MGTPGLLLGGRGSSDLGMAGVPGEGTQGTGWVRADQGRNPLEEGRICSAQQSGKFTNSLKNGKNFNQKEFI